ncbi:hypothetical protein WICPIJ_005111 [Wickerhamomyces pijperi]|uniref:Uncharacterized protein n=1 Tax=Wickerhamomyces pijperi TaxID=599730 RepID=A0A9P8TM45_WICPI|nr:hypothetical protein WICPIJ_005111 [Wickerhamomyces pijperi]
MRSTRSSLNYSLTVLNYVLIQMYMPYSDPNLTIPLKKASNSNFVTSATFTLVALIQTSTSSAPALTFHFNKTPKLSCEVFKIPALKTKPSEFVGTMVQFSLSFKRARYSNVTGAGERKAM